MHAVPPADGGMSLDELTASYERTIADATALVFAYLTTHPQDAELDLSRSDTTVPTLYRAAATAYPRLHDLGLTPTMWNRVATVALTALRVHLAQEAPGA